jgi:hypothetical protein
MEYSSMYCGSVSEIWRLPTEEQKKKVAVMKMEMKISVMGKIIELKKKAIVDIKQVQ